MTWQILTGRWQDVLPADLRVDHVITDPPYSEHVHSKSRAGARKVPLKDGNGRVTREKYRANGGQTVFPGSVHPRVEVHVVPMPVRTGQARARGEPGRNRPRPFVRNGPGAGGVNGGKMKFQNDWERRCWIAVYAAWQGQAIPQEEVENQWTENYFANDFETHEKNALFIADRAVEEFRKREPPDLGDVDV